MANFNNIIEAAQQNLTAAMQDDSVREIANSPLVSTIQISGRGLPAQQDQTIRVGSGGDRSVIVGTGGGRDMTLPSTTNKLNRVYGEVTTSGTIVDAYKEDANTIWLAFVISEFDPGYDATQPNDGPVGTLPFVYYGTAMTNVYYNNYELEFDGDPDLSAQGGIGGGTESNATLAVPLDRIESNTNLRTANVINVWAWAGNSDAQCQIFGQGYTPSAPYSTGTNAYDIFPTWDANITMANTIFSIVKVETYEDANTNFKIDNTVGNWRFGMRVRGLSQYESLYNPGKAMENYLTNDRYGVGLSISDLDTDSFNTWIDYCNGSITYYDGSYNTSTRRDIGAVLTTDGPVSENIQKIADAGTATLNYDNKSGKFKAFVNKPIEFFTNQDFVRWNEDYDLFIFDDDNIIGSINVNSTDLYSLYNFAEITFPNKLQQDQADTIIVQTPTADLVTNEPVSGMSMRLDTVNYRYLAAEIGNITLKQSRENKIITFTGNHNTMQVDAGDIVAIDIRKLQEIMPGDVVATGAAPYGNFEGEGTPANLKFYKVLRTREVDNDGAIMIDYTCVEYSNKPFRQIVYQDATNEPFATGVIDYITYQEGGSGFQSKYETYTPVPGNVYVFEGPVGANTDIYDSDTGSYLGNTSYTLSTLPNTPPWSTYTWDYANEGAIEVEPSTFSSATYPGFYLQKLDLVRQDSDPDSHIPDETITVYQRGPVGVPTAGDSSFMRMHKMPSTGTYKVRLQYYNGVQTLPYMESQVYTGANITITDNFVDGNAALNTYGNNSQFVQSVANTSALITGAPANFNLGTKRHDLTNVALGEWTLTSNMTFDYDLANISGNEYLTIGTEGNITFMNTTNVDIFTVSITGGGVSFDGNALLDKPNTAQIPYTMTNTVIIDPGHYGLDEKWYPCRANVEFSAYGYQMGTTTFYDMDYTLTNKSKYYRSS